MVKKLINNYLNRNIVYQLILVALIFCVYSYSWNYPIFDEWDDYIYILDNKHLTFSFSNILYWFTHTCHRCYLPFTMFSYMIDYSVWGLNSFGYHLQNICWHIVTVLVLYNCFSLFKIRLWLIFFMCLIFAVHPQRVESVVWLSERKDVLCAAFYFLSIYFYIKNRDTKFSYLAFLFFIISMLSKPMAVSLPIILLLYEFYRRGCGNHIVRGPCSVVRGQKSKIQHSTFKIKHQVIIRAFSVFRGYFIKLWPYFLVLFLFIPISIISQQDFNYIDNKVTFYERVYTVFFNVYWYIKETLFSTKLNPLYPTVKLFYSVIQVSAFYVAGLIIVIILFYKNRRLFIYSVLPVILCFVSSLLPVVGLMRLGVTDHADRYSYIPSVFIWFGVGGILTYFLGQVNYHKNKYKSSFYNSILFNKKLIFIVLTVYSSVLIINNIKYQWHWKNKFRLFDFSVKSVPSSYLALIYLIEMEYGRKNYPIVMKLSDKLRSEYGLDSLAVYYQSLVMYQFDREAAMKSLVRIEPELRKGVKFEASHMRYKNLLRYIISGYDSQGNAYKTLEYVEKMLSLPQLNNFMRLNCFGLKAFYMKKYQESIFWYTKALTVKPDNTFVLEKLALCRKQET